MVSGVEFSDSSLTCNTPRSSQQVPSLMHVTHLAHPSPPLLQQPSVCSLCLRVPYGLPPSLFLSYFSFPSPMFICCVSQIPHMSEIIRYFSFSDCLISFNIIPSSSIHLVGNGRISFFLIASIPLYMTHRLYPFIS